MAEQEKEKEWKGHSRYTNTRGVAGTARNKVESERNRRHCKRHNQQTRETASVEGEQLAALQRAMIAN